MEKWFFDNEADLRLACFLGIFLVMACWELLSPRKLLIKPKLLRWFNNISLTILNTAFIRLLFFMASISLVTGMATLAEKKSWGLFNMIEIGGGIEILASLLLLDLAIYFQHILFHKVFWLWRLHRVHHSDTDIDVTTGARFHPAEIILSIIFKMGLVFLIGPKVIAVILFEIILNACAMFNHANVLLPKHIDSLVRLILVTPDMHRVHHSIIRKETDSNFGFSIALWDRLFKTYCAQPEKGHDKMMIGVDEFREEKEVYIHKMLSQPFRK